MAMMDPYQQQRYVEEMMRREYEMKMRAMQNQMMPTGNYLDSPVPQEAKKPSKPKHMNPLLLLSKGAK